MKALTLSCRILAVLIFLLGIIHDVATFTPLVQNDISLLPLSVRNAVVFMSLGTGTSLILSGALLLMFGRPAVIALPSSPSALALVSAFVFFVGAAAFLSMPENPFAWLTVIIGATELFLVLRLIRKTGRRAFMEAA